MGAFIQHISYHLPETVFSNHDFFELFPEAKSNQNLEKIGVKQRVIAAENETASDLAVKAAQNLFAETGMDKSKIDFLIYSSLDFDYKLPATSCVIHGKLGLDPTCATLDLSHGCSAYVYALSVAKGMIVSNGCKSVLVLSANTLTKDIHKKDRASRFVFGDAAAATLVVSSETEGIQNCVFATDSKGWEKIIIRDGGARNPISTESRMEQVDEYGNVTTSAQFFMDGTGVFLFSLKRVPEIIHQTLQKNNLELQDIDGFVFHQANLYMIDTIVKKVGINPERVFNNMSAIGNTVGASIPIALAQAIQEGKITKGQKILLIGFGVGLSLSATIVII